MSLTANALQTAPAHDADIHADKNGYPTNPKRRSSSLSGGSPTFFPKSDARQSADAPPSLVSHPTSERRSIVWRFVVLHRERPRSLRLGVELEADALLSICGAQAYSIALKRAEEASSDEMARDWGDVAATVARKSGVYSSLLDALLG